MNKSWKHAITDYDNETVDTGRLIVMWACTTVLVTIIIMLIVAIIIVFMNDAHSFDFQNFGIGIGAILGGMATLLTSFAVYVFADNKDRPKVTMEGTVLKFPSQGPPITAAATPPQSIVKGEPIVPVEIIEITDTNRVK